MSTDSPPISANRPAAPVMGLARGPQTLILLLIFSLALIGYLFYPSLSWLYYEWSTKEEYSHGFMIPLITLFLIWQRRGLIAAQPQQGSWPGILLLLAGLAGLVLGRYSTLFIISHYSLLLVLFGITLATFGKGITRQVWVPMALLALAIPLPNFLYNKLSAHLQLLSSALGVEVIRACNISVYLEGNVIDLGKMKLQVVEACSGLRYLFPLMSLAFICSYLFQAPLWQRALVFLSSLPITVLMNSLRIGIIGVLVEYWGQGMAEGFLHDFEGWAVFMACALLLLGEIWVLATWVPPRSRLRDCFGLETTPFSSKAPLDHWRTTRTLIISLALLTLAALTLALSPENSEITPPRRTFAEFPLQLQDWSGTTTTMEQQYIDRLDFDDYILADYTKPGGVPVNFYVAYYGSQSSGESAHSPRSCIPGDGWKITEVTEIALSEKIHANRVLIQKGDTRQVVYYWFDQRGRNLTNEYLIKWYLFRDGLLQNRSDGALIRLTTVVPPGHPVDEADQRLQAFFQALGDRLEQFVPAE